MINKKIVLITLIILLTSCTTTETYEEEYNTTIKVIRELNLLLDYCEEEKTNNTKNKEALLKIKSEEIKIVRDFYETYAKAKKEFVTGVNYKHSANEEYNLWTYYYNENDPSNAIIHCEQSRKEITSANIHNQKAIQYFTQTKEYNMTIEYEKLTSAYLNYLSTVIDLNWALYESCEYYESAVKSYMKGGYDSADSELEKGNDKIGKHDSLVKRLNSFSAEIDVLEETR